jgi:hypothetical protein
MTRKRRRGSYYRPVSGRRLRRYLWRRLVPECGAPRWLRLAGRFAFPGHNGAQGVYSGQ